MKRTYTSYIFNSINLKDLLLFFIYKTKNMIINIRNRVGKADWADLTRKKVSQGILVGLPCARIGPPNPPKNSKENTKNFLKKKKRAGGQPVGLACFKSPLGRLKRNVG